MTLRERRIRKGFSQQKMADLMGVAYSTYRMWEYGMPTSKENEQKLEEVLNDTTSGAESEMGNVGQKEHGMG